MTSSQTNISKVWITVSDWIDMNLLDGPFQLAFTQVEHARS